MDNIPSRFPACLVPSRFPACLVTFPPGYERRRAAFYLAAEEHLAAAYPADNYLFSWILGPTVVMGRNQVAAQEINLDFCHREGIDIIRRKSGGGCIFADGRNIMFSLVTTEGAVEPIFADYAKHVAKGLNALGIPASVSGRNDIVLADGSKVCGNAFYHLAHRNIVHGTMLYDTDYRLMAGALNPDVKKLKSAGVKSVRSRTGLIKNVQPIGVGRLRHGLEELLCNRRVTLTTNDIAEIERLEAAYYDPQYLYGKTEGDVGVTCSDRIEGCGRLELHFVLEGESVKHIELSGDFFDLGDAAQRFNEAFVGLPLRRTALEEAVTRFHPETAIRGLSTEELLGLIGRHILS